MDEHDEPSRPARADRSDFANPGLDDVMAYVDGHLDAAARRSVEARVAASPELALQVEAYRLQNRALKTAFDPVLGEPVPARMQPPVRARSPVWLVSGFAATLVAGAAIGWFGHGWSVTTHPTSTFVLQAASAHIVYSPEVRHPVEVAANEEAHLVAWLSKRLGHKVSAPVLSNQGFRLVGGRLLPGDQARPAAQFMYEDSKGQRLTLYVRSLATRERDTAFRYARESGIDVFYWIDDQWGYALSGAVGRATMLDLAKVVYNDLTPR